MRVRRSPVVIVALVAFVLSGLIGPPLVLRIQAQGDAQPGEILLAGERYAFDRVVPVALDQLEERADDSGTPVWVPLGEEPPARVYVPLNDGSGTAARYLPESLRAPETACPATLAGGGTIQGQDTTYVPVGAEPDLGVDGLAEVGSTSDGRTIYAPSEEQPFQELFASTPEGGLVRYALFDPLVARPSNIGDTVAFAGQTFQLVPGAGLVTSLDDVVKVGCLAGYPAYAPSPEQPFAGIYLEVAGQVIAYQAVDTQPATPPASPPAPAIASPPIVEPIGTPKATPTDIALPTVFPTLAPEPTATTEPTLEPTATTEPAPEPTASSEPSPTAAPTTAAQPTVPVVPTPEPTAAATQPVSRPTPTPGMLQPPAVVPTLPPNAPPPAAATTESIRCAGDPGALDANGLPGRLPSNLQYGGTGYRFVASVPTSDAGNVTRVGCVGPFDLYTGTDAMFLGVQNVPETLYRFEASGSFAVDFEVTSDLRVIRLTGAHGEPDTRYVATDPWQRSVYSSVSLILFVEDPEIAEPERVLGYAVDGQAIGEYRLADASDPAPDDVLATAESLGMHPELTLGADGPAYVLTGLWKPFGTTTNGWVVLYGPTGDATPVELVGLDPRRLDLLVFNRAE